MAKKPSLQLAEALGHEIADKRLDILRRIGEVGSISEAARGAGVSYKAAWQAIDTLGNLAGTALLERMVGGSGGGGAQLTPAGQQLLQAAELLNQARQQVLKQITQGQSTPGLAALSLRTSMRNQLPCTVKALRTQGQAIQVEMRLCDGTPLFSRITRESAELLSLHAGQTVLALCKATAVEIFPAGQTATGRNLLLGRVTRASRARAGGEVALALDCGLQMVGFSGPDSGLQLNHAAQASVDASAVVIALAG
ncbi:TOBE domain-containing protein [Rhodoferax saidenbachensis]|uniref:ModE family transcriptional regulator n=1 Tax=Rhodoferax saidenbachensis TaxID=1484693 RepID=A0A1P8KC23_9BURK|nr:TOBE domain-containing protein [Rhodoferax saidenbachensis]APW43577.1 ModE family transcriptional regulator [Rhodoferax saidenbachensis]